jgi:ribosomal protein S13
MQHFFVGLQSGVVEAPKAALTNQEVASILDEVGDLLEAQAAQPYRALAYHRAATSVRELPSPIADFVESGLDHALESLPGIGENLARRILEILDTGRLQLLERLRGEAEPEALFRTVPGIGPRLAAEIHERLGIESLEELEMAAHDSRLSTVPGFGSRRLRAVEESLRARLGRRSLLARKSRDSRPPVAELLDVDEEYRKSAASGSLPRIAPRRFNPEKERWLPILHTRRKDRHYTAVFSNTARAHALGRTRDWVVLFYHEDDTPEGQATVVTEYRGELAGRRVVRGREAETLEHYQSK